MLLRIVSSTIPEATTGAESPAGSSLPEDPFDLSRGPIRLGRHVLLGTLGRGGMGVVYSAYDEKLDRNVAIKLLRTRRREQERRRLVREAQALARLSHPNVVRIYEICEHEQFDYLVMERVDGVTLGQWLTLRPRSREEILAVFLAAGAGLAAAHAKDIVHRDFKPENVMLREDGQVLVMDFGLARDRRAREGEGAEETSSDDESDEGLTRAGAIVGSVGYMAPEQVLGKVADARSDQFGFCVALWEAVHGRRPFAGTNMAAYRRAVLSGTPSLQERSDVPRWFRQVLERGLSREPDQRWPSMQELLDALRRDPTRRRRGWISAVAISGIALAAVVGWKVQQQREREDAIADCEALGQSIAEVWNDEVAAGIEQAFVATNSPLAASAWQHTRPWLDARASEWSRLRRETCLETRVDGTRNEAEFADIEACLDEQGVAFGELLDVLAGADEAIVKQAAVAAAELPPLSHCTNAALLARDVRPPDELRAQIATQRERLQRVGTLNLVGDFERALAEAREIADEAERVDWLPLQAEAWLAIAQQQHQLGRYDDAAAAAERSFRLAAIAGDELTMLNAATVRTHSGGELLPFELAVEWGHLGQELIEQLDLSGSVPEGILLVRLAKVQLKQGNYEQSLAHSQRALVILESALGPNHPRVGEVLHGMGVVYLQQEQLEEAVAVWRRQLSIFESALGPDSPRLVGVLNNLGIVSALQRDRERALVYYRRSLAITESTLGPDHPKAAMALVNIGNISLELGNHEAAASHLERAIEIQKAMLGPNHTDMGSAFESLGQVRAKQGDYAAALDAHRQALAIFETAWGPEHPGLSGVHARMGDTLLEMEDFAAAEQAHRRAVSIVEANGGFEDVGSIRALLGLGRAELGLGRIDEAEGHIERALTLHDDVASVERGWVRFHAGRVAWARGDEDRARALIESARDEIDDYPVTEELRDVQTWLAEHP
jgi:tetratricopeptide (TPR) repeat protein/predicted Ser/Thr protein kinase